MSKRIDFRLSDELHGELKKKDGTLSHNIRTAVTEYLQPKTIQKPVQMLEKTVNDKFLEHLLDENSRYLEIIEQDIAQLKDQYNRLMTNIEQTRYLKPKKEPDVLVSSNTGEEEVLTQKTVKINPQANIKDKVVVNPIVDDEVKATSGTATPTQKDYEEIKHHINSITLKKEEKEKKKKGLWERFIARM